MSDSPFMVIGAETPTSQPSMILMTSPRASSRFLPSSREQSFVISSAFCSSRAFQR